MLRIPTRMFAYDAVDGFSAGIATSAFGGLADIKIVVRDFRF